jgi:two-component system sensor histidine kinase KdpD
MIPVLTRMFCLHICKRRRNGRREGDKRYSSGYAAGVGKTYGMLKAAHERQKEGVDVQIGFVETQAGLRLKNL